MRLACTAGPYFTIIMQAIMILFKRLFLESNIALSLLRMSVINLFLQCSPSYSLHAISISYYYDFIDLLIVKLFLPLEVVIITFYLEIALV